MPWRIALLVFGVFCGSTAVIFIKESTVDPFLLAGYRQLVAAAILLPLFLRDFRRHRAWITPRQMARCIPPGLLLGGHFITWIIGARMTPAVNSSLIVNMIPVAMPFLLFLMVREKLNLGEIAGTALAVVGLAVLGVTDVNLSAEFFHGDAICFGSMLMVAWYMALARRNRDFPSLWLYIVPLYATGGVFCTLCGLTRVDFSAADSGRALLAALSLVEPRELVIILALGIVPTVMGHSISNYSMKHIRGQVVSLIGQCMFVLSGVLAFFQLGEVPGRSFYVAAALVVGGAVVALRAQPRPRPVAPEASEEGLAS